MAAYLLMTSVDVLATDVSATNNIEKVANYIIKITDGKTFEIELVVYHTSDELRCTNNNSSSYRGIGNE